jgi:tetratricopeptide (TPR) repeat protein/predicted Ser/Thr protein kinase
MSDLTMPADDSLPAADLERVIAVCERFERAWKEGRAPRVEDLQDELPEPLRPRLVRELRALECELRQAGGERSELSQPGRRAEAETAPDAGTPGHGATTDAADAAGGQGLSTPGVTETFGPPDRAGEEPGRTGTFANGPPSAESPWPTPATAGGASWIGDAGYEVLAEIGRGGMGVVYRARHRGLNRLVALKVIRGDAFARPDLLRRFRTEAEAVARLRHEHIVQVYDVGEIGGQPFVALELLEGGTLAAKLAGTPQPDRQAAEMARALARAVHAAHRAGIVHRDLKPLNVLLDEAGRPKVADFGLAKRLEAESGQTQSGQVIGTPSYMAPEQAGGRGAVGPAADVYALGAILYEMLTGRPPFKGPTPQATIHQVLHDDPVPPSRLQPRVSRDLETVCLKCLAKDPHRRYASAADLAADLDRFLDGRPVLARRTPAWEVGVKWARRHPARATLAALALASLAAAASAGVWYQDALQRRALDDGRHLAREFSEGTTALLKGQAELADGRPGEARVTLSNLLTSIRDEPVRLAALRARAADLLARADAAIDRERAEAARRAEVERDRERLRRFRESSARALYHQTQFAGLNPAASRGAARDAAEAALAVFAAPGAADGWSLGPLPEALSAAERREVREGCYVLLLILAGTEDGAERALRRLDAAARLRPPTWAYQRRLADALTLRGDAAGAERARREADRLAPETAFDHFLAGLDRHGRHDWAAALGHFDAALRVQPGHFWAHALAAVACLQPELRRPEPARVHLTACLHREPGLAWLYVLRGFASYEAAALAPDTPPAGAGSPFGLAEADYRTAETLLAEAPDPELRYVLLVNRGLLRLERRDWDGAVNDLEAAIRLDGRHYLAYANLAQVYQRQGQPDAAVAQFGRAIAARPDLAALYRGRAEVELNRKDPTPAQRARALRDLDEAVRRESPGNPVLARDHANRALLFFHDHDDARALAACDAALAVVPDHTEALLLRARALVRWKRYDDALRACDALLSRGKPTAEVYDLRRHAREGLNDFAGAIEDLTQALFLRPGRPDLLARRGELYLIENSPLLALRDFEAAVRLDPGHADARAGRAAARVRLGRYREAVADAEAAARLAPADPRVLYKAGRVYALAAVAATGEVRRAGPDAVAVVARYQDRAVGLVRAARARVPAADRAAFEAALRTDPAVGPIQRRLRPARPAEPGARAPR